MKMTSSQPFNTIVADALSRVPTTPWMEEPVNGDPSAAEVERPSLEEEGPDDSFSSCFDILVEEPLSADCFLSHPEFDDEGDIPFHFQTIRKCQQKDDALRQLQRDHPRMCPTKQFDGIDLICFDMANTRGSMSGLRIMLPDDMVDKLVQWHHLSLCHSLGATRLTDTVANYFHHPQLAKRVRQIVYGCPECQQHKVVSERCGESPPREAPLLPWSEVHVDRVGPWEVGLLGNKFYFNALTVIDPATNLLGLYRLPDKTAHRAGQTLQNGWFARCPRPQRCIYDQGNESLGQAFQQTLANAGAKGAPVNKRTPTADAVCERIHQAVAQVPRILMHTQPPSDTNELSRH